MPRPNRARQLVQRIRDRLGSPNETPRVAWERRYDEIDDLDALAWHADSPAPQLVELFESGGPATAGVALDIGGGAGVSSVFMTQHFSRVVLLDIAESVFRFLRATPAERASIDLVVAASPHLPFRDGVFDFVYDRGCMHVLPSQHWRAHLTSIAASLRPGGAALLLERHMTPSQLSGLLCPELELTSSSSFVQHMSGGGEDVPMLAARLRRV